MRSAEHHRAVQRFRIGTRRAATVVAAALSAPLLLAASAPAAGEAEFPRSRVLLRVPVVEGFAQDGSHIVWADSSRPCRQQVQLHELGSGKTIALTSSAGPSCRWGRRTPGGFQHRMALAGTRALWGYVHASLSSYHVDLATASASDAERALGSIHLNKDAETPFRPIPLAGDGATLVYAAIGDSEGQFPVGVHRVGTRASLVDGTSRTLALAVHGAGFAAARVAYRGCLCHFLSGWSPDGTHLVFTGRHRTADRQDAYVVDVRDGSVREVHHGGCCPSWSPSGTALALNTDTGTVIVDRAGRRLGTASGFFEGWSADGRFATRSDRAGTLAVQTVGGAARVVARNVSYRYTEWSPDGALLAYLTPIPDSLDYSLMVIPSRGGDPRRLATVPDEAAPRWSPDGRHIVFVGAGAPSGRGLVVVDVATGDKQALTGALGDREPSWSPDGSMLAYRDAQAWLAVVPSAGGATRRVAENVNSFSWSPTGPELLVERGGETISLVRPDGTGERLLARGSSGRWSRDGRQIAYLLGLEGEVATVHADGSQRKTITRTTVQRERRPVELRSGRSGALTGGYEVEAQTSVTAIALDAARVAAIVVGEARGGKRIEVRTRRGALIKRLAIARDAADEIGLSGRWIVYRVGLTIRVVDSRRWVDKALARARGTPIGVSIEGLRVAWGEQLPGMDEIRAITLPR